MKLFDLLPIDPKQIKVHLGKAKGPDELLHMFFSGGFKQWQEYQTKRNFGREYILSLIRYNSDSTWLFAGIYQSAGVEPLDSGHFKYTTELTDIAASLIGRLVIKYKRSGRNSYPKGESLFESAVVHEIKAEPLAFAEFRRFQDVCLTRTQLEMMVRNEFTSWKAALASVSGVYLIADTSNGKLYVGSAYGDQGIWGRWSTYAQTYHGGNKALKALYRDKDESAFATFEYSILETCDLTLPADAVIEIESRWKQRLLSREFGYNDN